MRNKVELKKMLIIFSCILILFLSIFLLLNIYEFHMYNKNYNYKISALVNTVKEKYPYIGEKEILETIKNYDNKNDILSKYSIDINDSFLIKKNRTLFLKFTVFNILFYLFTIFLILFYFLRFNKKKDLEINNITKYIEQINRNNYQLDLDDMSEDELSILKNEIYKTTINLKELAEQSTKDKLELKTSLSDISHQLKTPLTSILIILDNLIDEPDMDKNIRDSFIKDIKREISNINFLVQSLLKLSKLDTNSISFIEENVSIKKIINEVENNLSLLSDLKNVSLKYNIKKDICIICDFKWQVEALTNIVKNCIEYAEKDSTINIEVKSNKVYTKIIISDKGIEIDKDDINHIFERFYRGKNASNESIGIGLSLAKTIINKDNGSIDVESKNGITSFIIKYYSK